MRYLPQILSIMTMTMITFFETGFRCFAVLREAKMPPRSLKPPEGVSLFLYACHSEK